MSACCAPQPERGDPPPAAAAAPAAPRRPIEALPFVAIPAGAFTMGSASAEAIAADGEGPERTVDISGFQIMATAVTNRQFADFVEATGYVTDAERFGWSFVFVDHVRVADDSEVLDAHVPSAPWWRAVAGASWSRPCGSASDVTELAEHPVVHVSWNDAVAFANWHGARLPTESEWERAARGGRDGTTFPWGDELHPNGEHRANIWQGDFPTHNTAADGYATTAPVDAFAPNDFGLYCTSGNVWEWTSDWFSTTWHLPDRPETRRDPRGPSAGTAKSLRGGSFLCHASYCNRYRVAARTQNTPDASLGHTGFRLAADT